MNVSSILKLLAKGSMAALAIVAAGAIVYQLSTDPQESQNSDETVEITQSVEDQPQRIPVSPEVVQQVAPPVTPEPPLEPEVLEEGEGQPGAPAETAPASQPSGVTPPEAVPAGPAPAAPAVPAPVVSVPVIAPPAPVASKPAPVVAPPAVAPKVAPVVVAPLVAAPAATPSAPSLPEASALEADPSLPSEDTNVFAEPGEEAEPESPAEEEVKEEEPVVPSDPDMDAPVSDSNQDYEYIFGDEDIILDVYLRSDLVYQGLFCQGRDGKLFLPMSEIMAIVGFPITTDAEGAKGWFIKEQRKFTFSVETGEATSHGKTVQIPEDDYFDFEGDIFIKVEWFEELFPLKMLVDINALTLVITPSEFLPKEMMKLRKQNRRLYKAENGLLYPLRDLDYAAIAPPRLDAKVSGGYTNNGQDGKGSMSMTGLYRGDLLYLSTSIYGTIGHDLGNISSEPTYNNFSMTAERAFRENKYISNITMGDIVPATTPMGSGGSLERGVQVTNKGSFGSTTDESRTFTGKAIPGWDVELYRNKQLVGFQTVAEDGTYTFENVPLSYGVNRFKLMLYGTEGQEEVREEVVTIGESINKGEIEYDASVTQQGVGVFDEEYSKVSTASADLQGTTRSKVGANIGVGGGYALRTGVTHDTYNNSDRVVGSIGLSGGYQELLGLVDVGQSSRGSTFIKGSVRTQTEGGTSVSVNAFKQFSDKFDESNTDNSVSVSLNDYTNLSESVRLSYGGSLGRTSSVISDGKRSKYWDISGSASAFSDLGHVSTTLSTRFYEQKANSESPSTFGATSYYKSFSKGSVRASAEYGIDDEEDAHVKSLSAAANYRFDRRLSTSLNMSKYLIGSERFSIGNTWSYAMSYTTPYIQGTWYDDSSFSIFAGFSMSLDFNNDSIWPGLSKGNSDSGGASVLVYNDRNYNNIFDEDDMPLEDVQLRAFQSNQKVVTDENGRALFYHLPTMRDTDVAVIESSLKDLRLSPEEGTAITPRPGRVYNIEFPLHVTGEIEGYAYLLFNDQAKGKPLVPIQLLDEEGEVVRESWTESDGFFVLGKVLPGTYSIRIDPEFLSTRVYTGTEADNLSISREGDLLADNFLFYGEEKTVAVLEDKFTTAMKLGDDVQQFTDFSDLDAPVEGSAIIAPSERINEILKQENFGEEALAQNETDSANKTTSETAEPQAPLVADVAQSEAGKQAGEEALDDGWAQAAPESAASGTQTGAFGDLDAVPAVTAQAEPAPSLDAPAATAPPPTPAPTKAEEPEDDYSGYALIVDTFASEKTAARAVKHFSKMYDGKIPGMVIYHEKVGDSHLVLAKGFKTKAEVAEFAKLFISKPMLISIK